MSIPEKRIFLYNNGNRSTTRGSDYQFQKHPVLTHFLPVFRFSLQNVPFERPGVNELMILHFLQRKEIYEQSTVLTTKTAMCALFEFFEVRVRLRVGGRASVRTLPCERIERGTLPTMFARVAVHEPRPGAALQGHNISAGRLTSVLSLLRSRAAIRMCAVRQLHQFLYTLSYFFIMAQRSAPLKQFA